EEDGMGQREDARVAHDEVQRDRQHRVHAEEHGNVLQISQHALPRRTGRGLVCYDATARPNTPPGRNRMNRNSTTKVTASLHCGSIHASDRFSAMPSNRPATAAPRRLPTPPTMVAAILISMMWWPMDGFSPEVAAVRIAAGTASSEPIRNTYCDSRRGVRPYTRTRSGCSPSA